MNIQEIALELHELSLSMIESNQIMGKLAHVLHENELWDEHSDLFARHVELMAKQQVALLHVATELQD